MQGVVASGPQIPHLLKGSSETLVVSITITGGGDPATVAGHMGQSGYSLNGCSPVQQRPGSRGTRVNVGCRLHQAPSPLSEH